MSPCLAIILWFWIISSKLYFIFFKLFIMLRSSVPKSFNFFLLITKVVKLIHNMRVFLPRNKFGKKNISLLFFMNFWESYLWGTYHFFFGIFQRKGRFAEDAILVQRIAGNFNCLFHLVSRRIGIGPSPRSLIAET